MSNFFLQTDYLKSMEKQLLEKSLAGDIDAVKGLLDRGFSPNCPTHKGHTVLTAVCNVLLEALDIKPRYNNSRYCMNSYGVSQVKCDIHTITKLKKVIVLMVKHCQGEIFTDTHGKNVFNLCALTGDLVFMKELLNKFTNLDGNRNSILLTTLSQCSKDPKELVEYCLTTLSINPNLVDHSGKTALHYAAWFRHCDSIELLIKSGACVNFQCNYGNTPLMQLLSTIDEQKNSVMYSNVNTTFKRSVQLLLKANTNTKLKNNKQKTVFHYAAETLDVELWNNMMQHGTDADLRVYDYKGFTPLQSCILRAILKFSQMTARWHSLGRMVWAILKSGADLHITQEQSQNHITLVINIMTFGKPIDKVKVLEIFLAAGFNFQCLSNSSVYRMIQTVKRIGDYDFEKRLYELYGIQVDDHTCVKYGCRSLQNTCADIIRRCLRPNALRGINGLNLPTVLKDIIVPFTYT